MYIYDGGNNAQIGDIIAHNNLNPTRGNGNENYRKRDMDVKFIEILEKRPKTSETDFSLASARIYINPYFLSSSCVSVSISRYSTGNPVIIIIAIITEFLFLLLFSYLSYQNSWTKYIIIN